MTLSPKAKVFFMSSYSDIYGLSPKSKPFVPKQSLEKSSKLSADAKPFIPISVKLEAEREVEIVNKMDVLYINSSLSLI